MPLSIRLPPAIKPYEYRVGMFGHYRDGATSAIVWSRCLYNTTSAPTRTLADVSDCGAKNCFTVETMDYPCDDTGAEVVNHIVNYCNPDEVCKLFLD